LFLLCLTFESQNMSAVLYWKLCERRMSSRCSRFALVVSNLSEFLISKLNLCIYFELWKSCFFFSRIYSRCESFRSLLWVRWNWLKSLIYCISSSLFFAYLILFRNRYSFSVLTLIIESAFCLVSLIFFSILRSSTSRRTILFLSVLLSSIAFCLSI